MSRPSSTSSFGGPVPSIHSTSSSLLTPSEAQQRLERSQRQWSKTTEQLAELVRVRSNTPHMSPIEMYTKDQQIQDLQNRLKTMELEMMDSKNQLKTAENTILQQRMTIRNQSKAIENPRAGRDGAVTPSDQSLSYRQYGHGQQYGGPSPGVEFRGARNQMRAAQLPPPNDGMFPAQSTPGYPLVHDWSSAVGNSSADNTPQQFVKTGAHQVNSYGSPHQRRQAATSMYPQIDRQLGSGTAFGKYGPPNVCDSFSIPQAAPTEGLNPTTSRTDATMSLRSPESTTSSNPYPESSMPFKSAPQVTVSDAGADTKIRDSFRKTFDMVMKYARDHANFPSTAGDNALPQTTKQKLVHAATANAAFPLMSSGHTRYLLVTRIMLSWLIKHVLRYNTFSGLDTNIDQVIEGTKATMYQSTPDQLRYLLMSNVANEVKKIRDKPNFKAFIDHLSKQRANQLWILMRPMMHQKTDHDYEDLITLMHQVHKLAEVVFTSTDEFWFDFPEAASLYNPATVLNIDSQFSNYTADRLQALQTTVRLGITPTINARKNVAQGRSTTTTMLKALVLLKAPRT